MWSADDICKQFGPRSDLTKLRPDTLMLFLKEFFEKVDFEKHQQTTKKHEKLPSGQRVNPGLMTMLTPLMPNIVAVMLHANQTIYLSSADDFF